MITLSQRLKRKPQNNEPTSSNRASVRDRLLVKETQEMLLPASCQVHYDDENDLSSFMLIIKPTEGYYEGGTFKFKIKVTEEYNMVPPEVKCITKLWHPNISETGEVCLSLLRPHSTDGTGWTPIRRLNDVVWGLHSLFTDLLNFEDPLNVEAAEMYKNSREEFKTKVGGYVDSYAKDN